MLSIKCPSCGGTVTFNKDHIATFCSFCGSHLPDMADYVKKSIDLDIEQRMHEMDMQIAEKEIRKQKLKNYAVKANNTVDIVRYIIGGGAVILFFVMIIIIFIKIL